MTMRVLYSFPGRIGTVGVGTTAWYQVTGLIKLGVRVTLYCGSCERPIAGADCVVETMRVARVPVPYRLFGNEFSYRFHDEKVARHLKSRPNVYDVVHAWPLGALKTLQVAGMKGIPSFLERQNTHTAHAYSSVSEEHAKLGLPVPKENSHAYHQGRLNRELLEYDAADYLLCPSDFVAQTFIDREYSVNRIARHQYGYDPELFTLADDTGQDNRTHGLTAIFIGRCEPRKGLHYALQAWHESGACEHGRFIICGSFIPGYRELLQPYLDHASVEYRGFTSDIPSVMRSADILLLPAIEEGSALVTYEARGSGCVLFVSHAAGAIAEDGVDALVHEVGNVDQLSNQLSIACSNTDYFNSIRARSRQYAPAVTWGAAAASLLNAYNIGRHATTTNSENLS